LRLPCAMHVAKIIHTGNAYRMLIRKRRGQRRLERPMTRWENNIKTDIRYNVYVARV